MTPRGALAALAPAARRLLPWARVRGVAESVEEVAVGGSVTVVHPARDIVRAPVPGGPAAFERLRTHRHPPALRALLRGARVVGDHPLVLTADRRALLASTFDREQLDANAVMHAPLPAARRLRGRHLLLTNPWANNHFHWMLDTLPRAALLPLGDEPDTPVIVPAGLTADQRWSLERAGIAADRLVPFAGGQARVDELVFPSLVGGTGNPPRWALDWLRERLVPAPARRGRRLYVSRADSGLRRVLGEDALVAALEPLGFERILSGSLPLAEQLRAFAEAEMVVGPHGAGLVGLLACGPGTRVVELFGERYVNGCYYALADALDLEYRCLVCPDDEAQDMRVDHDAVRRLLG